jgi:hypothetical protein
MSSSSQMADGVTLNIPNRKNSSLQPASKSKPLPKLVGNHVDSYNPNVLQVPGKKPSSLFPNSGSQMSSRDSNLKKSTVDDSQMKQVS